MSKMVKNKSTFFLIKNLLLFSNKRQKGMALIMVLSTIVFIILIIQETVFDTQVEYRSAISELNSLRAYYAAKSGMEVNILRVKTYIKITDTYSSHIKPFQSAVDLIWQFPFQWPPSIPSETNSRDKEDLAKIKENSFMQASFITTIKPENSRIDINDLASPIPSLRKWTFEVLYRLMYHLRLQNQKLAEEIQEAEIIEILHNIKDYVDPDTQLEQSQLSEPSSNVNRSLISLEELHEVKSISDYLYAVIEPFITIYGEKGLNINAASVQLIQALHDELPIELAEEIVALRSNPANPIIFTEDSFRQFLQEKEFYDLAKYLLPPKQKSETTSTASQTENPEQESISYIYFDAPHNFRMQSIGIAGKSKKTLTATYFDTSYCLTRTRTLMEREKKLKKKQITNQVYQGQIRRTPKDKQQSQAVKQTHLPTIIYWKESF